MPRRTRFDKRRDLLTLDRDLMLLLGPSPALPGVVSQRPCPQPGSEEWESLHACWEANRDRYNERSWGFLAFEAGDVEAALKANPLEPVD